MKLLFLGLMFDVVCFCGVCGFLCFAVDFGIWILRGFVFLGLWVFGVVVLLVHCCYFVATLFV